MWLFTVTAKYSEIIKIRNSEIIRRSQGVHEKWAFNQKELLKFSEFQECKVK